MGQDYLAMPAAAQRLTGAIYANHFKLLAGFPWRVPGSLLNNLLQQADHRVCFLDMHLSCCLVLTDSPARPLVLASSPPPVPAPAAAAAAAARVAAACVSVRPRTFSKRRLLLASAVLKPVAGLLVLLASEAAPATAAAVGLTDAGNPSLQSMGCSVMSRVIAQHWRRSRWEHELQADPCSDQLPATGSRHIKVGGRARPCNSASGEALHAHAGAAEPLI